MLSPTMLFEFIANYPIATICVAQTTYMILEVEGAHLFRVDFQEKVEAKLKPGKTGELGYYVDHPLLINHNKEKAAIYINSVPSNPQGLYEDIQRGIANVSHVSKRWNDWQTGFIKSDFLTAISTLKQNIIDGSGLLLDSAPPSIATALLTACDKHKVATKTFAEPNPYSYTLLTIGSFYVIANDFMVHQLQ